LFLFREQRISAAYEYEDAQKSCHVLGKRRHIAHFENVVEKEKVDEEKSEYEHNVDHFSHMNMIYHGSEYSHEQG
jgi:hypothetical protein